MKKLNILRIIFLIILAILVFFTSITQKNVETNLLKAFFHDNSQDELIVNLSEKYSANINILFESTNLDALKTTKEIFQSEINENIFELNDTNITKSLEFYKKHKSVLLSNADYNTLRVGNFNEISNKAIENLFNPLGFSILSETEDPFYLFTNYLASLGTDGIQSFYDEKYYEIINIKVKNGLGLSPTLMNEEVEELVNLQKEFRNDEVEIYLTGTPIHSYFASARSIVEINLLCIISTLFVAGLVFWYFRSLKILIPILTTLAIGMGMGFCVSSILFSSIHILTFVFSTTLIGICVDYSLHYLMESELKRTLKSLTVSMLSTVCALLILTITQIELLKQIAVFTSTGLITVYSLVTLFYPLLPAQTSKQKFNLKINRKIGTIILTTVGIFILTGLFGLEFNDDIRAMYTPSKAMAQAEMLFSKISGKGANTSFLIVKGENLEEILKQEESIRQELEKNNIKYHSLSKFFPSKTQQTENFSLQKELYKTELKTFDKILAKQDMDSLKTLQPEYFSEKIFEELPQLKEFILDKNHTLIVLYDIKKTDILKKYNNVSYINLPQEISDGIRSIRIACLKILVPIYVLLFVILGFIFSFKNATKILAPSVLASLFAIGTIGIFTPINLFHILAVFLITGFGLDYSVFRFNGSKNVNDAVLISCVTTVFSFLMLGFTSFKLISSLGLVLALGLSCSYILSITMIKKTD